MVAIAIEQAFGEGYNIVARAADEQLFARQAATTTTVSPAQSSTPVTNSTSGPSSSPLLFFVALGFGVVFTNLWIIVGVKYCFRYNARNRALRNGEDVDQINMDNMPPRPHRRRKEKKLMSMDEVNERFPLTKYKTWVANRLSAGLPTAGGVTTPPSRAGSVRGVELMAPSSPVDTKHSVNTRPATANSDAAIDYPGVNTEQNKVVEPPVVSKPVADEEKDKDKTPPSTEPVFKPEDTTEAPVGKHVSSTSIDDDEDEDDHIHTAVPPELLANPGDTCAICIDTLEDDDDIRGLTCGHAFHAGCLDPWLTSRRACCPLCKADYYTPKPRPEGEQIDLTDRAARRREARMNLPQPPRSAWAGFRAGTLFMPSSRHEVGTFRADATRDDIERQRAERRARRAAAAATTDAQASGQQAAVPAPNTDTNTTPAVTTSAPSRFRNPFSSMAIHLPGRNRPANATAGQTEPSPSQLEAGTAPAAR